MVPILHSQVPPSFSLLALQGKWGTPWISYHERRPGREKGRENLIEAGSINGQLLAAWLAL